MAISQKCKCGAVIDIRRPGACCTACRVAKAKARLLKNKAKAKQTK